MNFQRAEPLERSASAVLLFLRCACLRPSRCQLKRCRCLKRASRETCFCGPRQHQAVLVCDVLVISSVRMRLSLVPVCSPTFSFSGAPTFRFRMRPDPRPCEARRVFSHSSRVESSRTTARDHEGTPRMAKVLRSDPFLLYAALCRLVLFSIPLHLRFASYRWPSKASASPSFVAEGLTTFCHQCPFEARHQSPHRGRRW